MTRKPYVMKSSVEKVVSYVATKLVVSVADVAEHFNISRATARRKLDGGVERGVLIRDEYSDGGKRLNFEQWRYGIAETL
jgi:response regulator of citrate/malate metabolism